MVQIERDGRKRLNVKEAGHQHAPWGRMGLKWKSTILFVFFYEGLVVLCWNLECFLL